MKKNAVCHDVPALYRAGATINEIMALTGLSRSTVEYRIYIQKPRRSKTPRKCLCCGRQFASEGPHNRLCAICRSKSLTDTELWGGA